MEKCSIDYKYVDKCLRKQCRLRSDCSAIRVCTVLPLSLHLSMTLKYSKTTVQNLGLIPQVFQMSEFFSLYTVIYEPRHEKTCLPVDSTWLAQLQRLASVLKCQLYLVKVLYYLGSEQQRCWSDCADAQADLHLCCSHMAKTGILMTWLISKRTWDLIVEANTGNEWPLISWINMRGSSVVR